MEDSTRRPSGPETYSALFEQAPDVVMGNPLVYAVLVDALHHGVESFYASREAAFRQAKDKEAEGMIHFIQPELMKKTIEDCYALLNVAKDVADGKYPKSKARSQYMQTGDGTWEDRLFLNFRTLLEEPKYS